MFMVRLATSVHCHSRLGRVGAGLSDARHLCKCRLIASAQVRASLEAASVF